MKNVSLRNKILFIVLLLLILSLCIFSIGLNSLSKMNSRLLKIIDISAEKIKLAARVKQDILFISRAEKNCILSYNSDNIDKYEKNILSEIEDLTIRKKKLRNLVDENGRKLLDDFESHWEKYFGINQKVIALCREKKVDDAFALSSGKGRELSNKAESIMTEIVEKNIKDFDSDKVAAEKNYTFARNLMISITIIGFIIAFSFSLYIVSQITKSLKNLLSGLNRISTAELEDSSVKFKRIIDGIHESAEQVANAANEVALASESLSEGSSEQAASIEETSASMDQIEAMTQENNKNTQLSDQLMKNTTEQIKILNQSILEVSKASEETSKIIKTIDEIAFQTNLLSLNASVEAARAGSAGAGFAVVAEEVRKLALRSAEAAQNTANLIESIVIKVKHGREIVTEANKSFGKVASLSSEIYQSSKEQYNGISQTKVAIDQVSKVIQQNAANSEQSASAANELTSQAESMKHHVRALIKIVG